MTTSDIEAFTSVPLKWAAKLRARRTDQSDDVEAAEQQRIRWPLGAHSSQPTAHSYSCSTSSFKEKRSRTQRQQQQQQHRMGLNLVLLVILIVFSTLCSSLQASQQLVGPTSEQSNSLLRHHAHYLNIIPSTHFSYQEGRQVAGVARSLEEAAVAPPQTGGHDQDDDQHHQQHIYKRSSAALLGPAPVARHPPLVSSSRASLNPLSRRMMSASSGHQIWPQVGAGISDEQLALASSSNQETSIAADENDNNKYISQQQQQQQQQVRPQWASTTTSSSKDDELLRQKQHIQYHDQWPSMAGKCHKRTLNFCAQVLPFNTTTFPNIIGDTNRFEVKRSLPFFGFLAKSTCNRRLDELLCLLLEPPCSAQTGLALPPCKKFCRLALEGCNEYIPATLALSSVFDCRQYPDSNEPGVCINLAQGSKCAHDEFKCPDKTCIPREYLFGHINLLVCLDNPTNYG